MLHSCCNDSSSILGIAFYVFKLFCSIIYLYLESFRFLKYCLNFNKKQYKFTDKKVYKKTAYQLKKWNFEIFFLGLDSKFNVRLMKIILVPFYYYLSFCYYYILFCFSWILYRILFFNNIVEIQNFLLLLLSNESVSNCFQIVVLSGILFFLFYFILFISYLFYIFLFCIICENLLTWFFSLFIFKLFFKIIIILIVLNLPIIFWKLILQ